MKKSVIIARTAAEQSFYKHFNPEKALTLKGSILNDFPKQETQTHDDLIIGWLDPVKGLALCRVKSSDLQSTCLGHMHIVPGVLMSEIASSICRMLSLPNLDYSSKNEFRDLEMQTVAISNEYTGFATHGARASRCDNLICYACREGVSSRGQVYRYSIYKECPNYLAQQICYGKLTIACRGTAINSQKCNLEPPEVESSKFNFRLRAPDWERLFRDSIYTNEMLPHTEQWSLLDEIKVSPKEDRAISYSKLSGFDYMCFDKALKMISAEVLNQTGAAHVRACNKTAIKKLYLKRSVLRYPELNFDILGDDLACQVDHIGPYEGYHRFYGSVGISGLDNAFYPVCYAYFEGEGK